MAARTRPLDEVDRLLAAARLPRAPAKPRATRAPAAPAKPRATSVAGALAPRPSLYVEPVREPADAAPATVTRDPRFGYPAGAYGRSPSVGASGASVDWAEEERAWEARHRPYLGASAAEDAYPSEPSTRRAAAPSSWGIGPGWGVRLGDSRPPSSAGWYPGSVRALDAARAGTGMAPHVERAVSARVAASPPSSSPTMRSVAPSRAPVSSTLPAPREVPPPPAPSRRSPTSVTVRSGVPFVPPPPRPLTGKLRGTARTSGTFHDKLEECRKRIVLEAVAEAGGNRSQAARGLGLTVRALRKVAERTRSV